MHRIRSLRCSVFGLVLVTAAPSFAQQERQPAPRPDFHVQASVARTDEELSRIAPDRVLLKLRVHVAHDLLDQALRPLGAQWLEAGQDEAFEVLEVRPGTVGAWVSWLSSVDGVEYAEPDPYAYASGSPNDPFFAPYQWNFFDRGTVSANAVSNFGVQGQTAWDTSTGAGIVVAIVDTGVKVGTDLANVTFVSPYNFVSNTTNATDDNGHGTHVCGTVRQATNNALGCAGLAYGTVIMPVKVLDSRGSGSYSAISNGIRWAADHGAKVINMSLGGSLSSSTLKSAVDYAWGKGVVLCAATGNTGRNKLQYPAAYPNCIAVGATRFDGKRPSYATYGSGIDVVAPGGDTSVDQNGDRYPDGILQQTFGSSGWGYYFFQGTSMATPHVTAVAALVWAKTPGKSNAQVRSAIETSAFDLGSSGYDTVYGWGLVDAAKALTQ